MSSTAGNPLPYNVSLTDQSAIIQFYPHREGPIDTQWNVTYSDSVFAKWSYDDTFGAGTSLHRTTYAGATCIIQWAGTAVWVFGGTSNDGSYTVSIDDSTPFHGEGSVSGLLFSKTSLVYGLHIMNLTVTGGEVSVSGATITVGMGDPGTVLQTRNMSANDLPQAQESLPWTNSDLYTNQSSGYYCITTNQLYATLTFTLTESVGFILYGSDDWQQGLFDVTVNSSNMDALSSVTSNSIQYSPRALWTQLNLPKYLASGLDRTASYDVVIQNLGANFNLASVVVYDALPSAQASSQAITSIGTLAPLSMTTNTDSITSLSMPVSATETPLHTGSIHSGTSTKAAIVASAVVGGIILSSIAILVAYRNAARQRKKRLLLSAGTIDAGQAPKYHFDMARRTSPTWQPTSPSPANSGSLLAQPVHDSSPPSYLSQNPNAYEIIGSRLHERDAGPVIQPPVYDPAWAASE